VSVAVAAVLDAGLREPPDRWHPVMWMGRWLAFAGARLPSAPAGRAIVAGGAAWTAGAVATAVAAAVADRALSRLPAVLALMGRGTLLWTLLSRRLLLDEVAGVEDGLERSLADGRAAVGRLVSRDVTDADAGMVRGAAIESLAENLSDSVIAPIWWYLAGGLPAAAVYRYANTADACWGYRDDRWRWAGRVAARVDDVANLVPARLTGLLLAGRRVTCRPGGWRQLRREAACTASPNAGWPMAATALRLGITLDKPGAYSLCADGREATPADTGQALRRCAAVSAAVLTVAAVWEVATCRR
jgi:adenosylcobinamide-phosphate synthase